MKFARRRLTYANVMSTIAVFLVVAGGSAFAANQLGKNTVGSKQLKSNAVTSAKIKKGAVTGSKIAKGAVGASAINTTGLIVPNATHASSADNATNAVNAGNAGTVGGQSVVKIDKTFNAGESVTVVSVGGFTITATCFSGEVQATLHTPATSGSVAWSQGNGSSTGNFFVYDAAQTGEPSEVSLGDTNKYATGTFSAAMASGTVASGVVGLDYDTFDDNPENVCIVAGHMSVG